MATAATARNQPVTSKYPYTYKSLFTRPPSTNTGDGPTGPTAGTAQTNYAAALKARLSNSPVSATQTSTANQQVSAVAPAAQQRTTSATPAASVSSVAARTGTTGNADYASMLKSRLASNTGNTSGLASMLASARGLTGSGYSYGSDNGDTSYTTRQSSGQGDSSTPFSYMSDEEAQSKAKSQLDPTYNSLRDRMDASYASDRDHINAQLAARYGGLTGLRGGRAQSSYDQNTQEHSLAISDLENKRVTAVNEMAQALQDKDYQRAYQMYALNKQLEYQQQQLELQQEQLDFSKDSWQQEFDYGKTQDALENDWKQKYYDRDVLESDRNYDWGVYTDSRDYDRSVLESDRNYDWETNPDNWYNQLYQESTGLDNAYKKAQINKMYSSGSGSGSGDGLSAWQQYQIWQDQQESEAGNYWKYTPNNVAEALVAISNGTETPESINWDLTARLNAGQITADEYNQWMYKIFPNQSGASGYPSYGGATLQDLLSNR